MWPRRRRPRSLFISYRRKDAAHTELFDREATRRYGRSRVFRDTESIEGGDDWRRRLDAELDRAAVVVAVIGPVWVAETRPDGLLGQPGDYVRYELRRAKERDLLTIPLTMGDVRLPAPEDLPEDLRWIPDLHNPALATEQSRGRQKALRAADKSLGWWARTLHRGVVVVVGVTLALSGITAVLAWPRPDLPTFDIGQSALLIVPPTQRFADGSLKATAIGARFTAELADALRASGAVSPATTISVADEAFAVVDTGPSRAAAIAGLSARSGADVLITGTLEASPTTSNFEPEVYLGDLLDAEELAGEQIQVNRSALRGLDVDVSRVDGAVGELAGQAARALGVMGGLLDALGTYERRDMERAGADLATLLAERAFSGNRTLAVLHHLRGNAEAVLGQRAEADREYRAALTANPGYERSMLGLAELTLLDSGSRCRQGADSQGLTDAEQAFQEIYDHAASVTVREKAVVGLARVSLCRVQAFDDVPGIWQPEATNAYRRLDAVLVDLPTGTTPDPSAAETLAVARLTRGRLTAVLNTALRPSVAGPRDASTAVEDFRQVSTLTRRPWLKADAQIALAELLERRPDLGSAAAAWTEACAADQRTLHLGPGAAIEEQTRRSMRSISNAGVPCTPDKG